MSADGPKPVKNAEGARATGKSGGKADAGPTPYRGTKVKKFSARTHINPTTIEFLGNFWEEGGFASEDGETATRDARSNTVAWSAVSEITVEDAPLLATTYAGDERIGDVGNFLVFLVSECGVDPEVAGAVCARLELAPSQTDWRALCVWQHAMSLPPAQRILSALREEV